MQDLYSDDLTNAWIFNCIYELKDQLASLHSKYFEIRFKNLIPYILHKRVKNTSQNGMVLLTFENLVQYVA